MDPTGGDLAALRILPSGHLYGLLGSVARQIAAQNDTISSTFSQGPRNRRMPRTTGALHCAVLCCAAVRSAVLRMTRTTGGLPRSCSAPAALCCA